MPKKWVCVEVEISGQLRRFVGKLEYPFQKELERSRGKEFSQFDCMMVQSGDVWRAYPEDAVPGVFGQVALRRDRIISFLPLRDAASHWEETWRGLTTP